MKKIFIATVCLVTALASLAGDARRAKSDWVETVDQSNLCHSENLHDATGYYVSRDGFYGYKYRIEYWLVEVKADHLIATKIVGDRNVPRGKISWMTIDKLGCHTNTEKIPISVQITEDIHNPEGYSWNSQVNYFSIKSNDLLAMSITIQGRYVVGQLERIGQKRAEQAVELKKYDQPLVREEYFFVVSKHHLFKY